MNIMLKRDDTEDTFEAEVLAVLYRDGKKLFAVMAMLDDAPWVRPHSRGQHRMGI